MCLSFIHLIFGEMHACCNADSAFKSGSRNAAVLLLPEINMGSFSASVKLMGTCSLASIGFRHPLSSHASDSGAPSNRFILPFQLDFFLSHASPEAEGYGAR
jgi:hypothetical protein